MSYKKHTIDIVKYIAAWEYVNGSLSSIFEDEYKDFVVGLKKVCMRPNVAARAALTKEEFDDMVAEVTNND